ncbi:hypothetical protein BD309DRAFT_477545 [Dichomitus squalens]|nr:hypothetical protein BD309DRAFT_477545 [Dichomitus squalens]
MQNVPSASLPYSWSRSAPLLMPPDRTSQARTCSKHRRPSATGARAACLVIRMSKLRSSQHPRVMAPRSPSCPRKSASHMSSSYVMGFATFGDGNRSR